MAKLKENSTILKHTGEEIIATEESVDRKLLSKADKDYVDTHKAEKATQDTLGHIRLQDIPVKSVNSKTGEVMIDVGDIAGLVSSKLALGLNASATGQEAIALGRGASATGEEAIALGKDASATGEEAIALGRGASATGQEAIALGRGASATKIFALALGRATEATGDCSTALGNLASAGDFAVALGFSTSATGYCSAALGKGASVSNSNEGILGGTGSYNTSKWKVPGSFTVSGTKNFEIPHPKPEKQSTHVIRHGAVESPTPGDTLYRWRVQATKDNDLVTIDLPDYFVWLNKDVQIFVTPQGHFGNGYGILNRETEQLEIHCQYEGEYNVLVIGTRNDNHQSVQDWDIKGVEREIGESWTGETYVIEVDEILEVEEIKEVV